MADKSNQLILAALSRAAAAAEAVPLHSNKTQAGLFPTNAAGKQAAQRCQEEGYLCLVSPCESDSVNGNSAIMVAKKKTARVPLCTITEKGLAYLLSQVSPRQVLEDFVRALEVRRSQADELLHLARQMHHATEVLKDNVDKIFQHICKIESSSSPGATGNLKALFAGFLKDSELCSAKAGLAPGISDKQDASSTKASALHDALLAELTRWQHSPAGATEDCPLPHLYRQTAAPSIGQFHDALRQLHELRKIYLHPWTGPLYDIPEPPYALLIGHEIVYYASIRK